MSMAIGNLLLLVSFYMGMWMEIGEIPEGPSLREFSVNGTYVVYRKLSQNVDQFRDYLSKTAERFGVSADFLATKMVGRTRDGTALVDDPPQGEDFNDFIYGDDTEGLKCPLGSHVRRANPRDTLGFQTLLVDRHRILRRAIPYGSLIPKGVAQAAVNEPVSVQAEDGSTASYPGQGLIFIALNIDIVRQFEFVQSQWINFGNDLNQGSDRDPIIGNHSGEEADSRMIFPHEDDKPIVVCADLPRFVEDAWG